MKNTVNIYSDGGSRGNPGPAASAYVAKTGNGEVLSEEGLYLGEATNNVAEYEAILLAWQWLRHQQQIKKAQFFIDSQLAVRQLTGVYKIKNTALKKIIRKIKRLESLVDFAVKYQHLSREKNTEADALVNQVLDKNTKEKKADNN
jgi:ribonuclease HI